jgi:hypothetical protein
MASLIIVAEQNPYEITAKSLFEFYRIEVPTQKVISHRDQFFAACRTPLNFETLHLYRVEKW